MILRFLILTVIMSALCYAAIWLGTKRQRRSVAQIGWRVGISIVIASLFVGVILTLEKFT